MSPMGPQERYDAVVVCQHVPMIFCNTTEKNDFKGLFCFLQGNDQVRFEMTYYALYPEVKVGTAYLSIVWNINVAKNVL